MSTPELNKALVAVMLEIENPRFDSTNPHFKNKFASLKSVLGAVRPLFASHGIAIIQELITSNEGGVGCITHLKHESGEEAALGPFIVKPTKMDPQGQASASTYARRYCLQAVASVVGDDDDDGNAASESPWSSKQMRTKVWKALRDAAAEEDSLKAIETWRELNQDQQMDIWHDLSSGQRSTIKVLLKEDKE